ncbi:phosphotransferase [Lactiplantibacillus sp. DA1]|uniref:phosphotransferase n=1 Tax=Lactiplantibacillus sp. DA1 TaxID=3079857 RepID=UPI00292A6668|nr:phosphotransferase [Lactiplantibacillus sp. DA1]MDV0430332.1 phosphotransferase [Lactiplantibacillus sp. DA1]
MRTLHKTLTRLLQADLIPIAHVSFNEMYTGYSRRYDTVVFVKVFDPDRERKFRTEQQVTAQLTHRVLASFQLASHEWVLVLRDWQLTPVPTTLTPALVYQMGQAVSQFHHAIQLPTTPDTMPVLDFDGMVARVERLKTSLHYGELVSALQYFFDHRMMIRTALAQQPVVTLHGDMGTRNFRYHHGRLVLIDFERARRGYALEDCLKFFFEALQQSSTLIQAFWAGYGTDLQIPPLVTQWLLFQCSTGIFTYVNQITDPRFEAVGTAMLAQVTLPNH